TSANSSSAHGGKATVTRGFSASSPNSSRRIGSEAEGPNCTAWPGDAPAAACDCRPPPPGDVLIAILRLPNLMPRLKREVSVQVVPARPEAGQPHRHEPIEPRIT